jgi:hypothetical protein
VESKAGKATSDSPASAAHNATRCNFWGMKIITVSLQSAARNAALRRMAAEPCIRVTEQVVSLPDPVTVSSRSPANL